MRQIPSFCSFRPTREMDHWFSGSGSDSDGDGVWVGVLNERLRRNHDEAWK